MPISSTPLEAPLLGEPYLLTPGPLTTSAKVKQAMLRDWGSWDGEFRALTQEMRTSLLELTGDTKGELDCVPMQGSGSFSVEAMLGSFVPRDGKVLVLSNGAYGLRIAQTLGYLGIANSIAGLIFVHVVYGLAFTTLFFRNFYVSVPTELTKAARIDGAGFFTIFWRIILPLSPPIIVVCVIWQFTQIWNDFLFGVVFSSGERQPITVALNNLVNTSTGVKEYNVDMAAAIIAGLPTLFVYIVAGKYFLRGLTAGAVKG